MQLHIPQKLTEHLTLNLAPNPGLDSSLATLISTGHILTQSLNLTLALTFEENPNSLGNHLFHMDFLLQITLNLFQAPITEQPPLASKAVIPPFNPEAPSGHCPYVIRTLSLNLPHTHYLKTNTNPNPGARI